MAMAYSTSVGGVCCVPSALRTRKSTTEILRNAVVVITANGISPIAAVAMMTGSNAWSCMATDPHYLHADIAANCHNAAAADAPPIGNNIHRLRLIAAELKHVARAQRLQ